MSGTVPTDPSLDIKGQTAQVLACLDNRLKLAGSEKGYLVSATIWLADVKNDVNGFNEVWNSWVVSGRQPARAAIQAELQGGAKVEIAVVAVVLTG